VDDYPDSRSAILIFLWLVWLAEQRGGTHHGPVQPILIGGRLLS
jgi:hypothetical protein